MKKTLIATMVLLACVMAWAGIVTTTTTYFTNTAFVATSETWTNSFTGSAIIFDVAELNNLTDADASNDVREVIFNMLAYLYDTIEAQDSTNQMVNFTINQNISMDSATNADISYSHNVRTKQAISAESIPAE